MSGALFLAADIFAVTSLAMPDWITTEVGEYNTLYSMKQGRIQEFVQRGLKFFSLSRGDSAPVGA